MKVVRQTILKNSNTGEKNNIAPSSGEAGTQGVKRSE